MKTASGRVVVFVIAFCVFAFAVAYSESFPPGEWAFNYAPEEAVLLLREDGTAVFKGQDYSWKDDGVRILFSREDGEEFTLRYLVAEKKVLLYLPTVYIRAEDDPGEGLTGAWIGKEAEGSTFIFREDGMFLEDGTFAGVYQVDQEAGTFLLIYPDYFDDTLCYFRLEGNDTLAVEYPWPLVKKETVH